MPTIPKTFTGERFENNPNDLFVTLPEVALACVNCLPYLTNGCKTILDIGCGTGVFGTAAKQTYPGSIITCVDLVEQKECYGIYDTYHPNTDFIEYSLLMSKRYDLVIGNPPYSSKDNRYLAESFVLHGLHMLDANGYLGLLLKTEFLVSKRRYENIFKHHAPLYVYQLIPRPYWNGAKGSNTIEYAFYIWKKQTNTETRIRWLNWKT